MSELEGVQEDEKFEKHMLGELGWDFMEWKEFHYVEMKEEEEEERGVGDMTEKRLETEDSISNNSDDNGFESRSKMQQGFHGLSKSDSNYPGLEEEKMISLNLNYQEVLDAWSDRGSLWADNDSYVSGYERNKAIFSSDFKAQKVHVMEEEHEQEEKEEKSERRARVLRYKEKRRSRMFCKKIRYQVRKLNAEKKPRLKGRFVKSTIEDSYV